MGFCRVRVGPLRSPAAPWDQGSMDTHPTHTYPSRSAARVSLPLSPRALENIPNGTHALSVVPSDSAGY